MDKDLFRLIILGMGGVLIVGILLWGIFANRKSKRPMDFYDQRNPLDKIDESLIINTDDDEFDIIPLGSAVDNRQDELDFQDDAVPAFDTDPNLNEINQQPAQVQKSEPLGILQFSIAAKTDAEFNGAQLADAFNAIGLHYTDLQIFQRLDNTGQPDYAVASMVEPGTFPEHDMDSFRCPGIVFFMQPSELDNPLVVFDEMLDSINHLAQALNGEVRDSERQTLTIETVQAIRDKLDA